MKKETFKELIEIESKRHKTISEFKNAVLTLIDIYESDRSSTEVVYTPHYVDPSQPFRNIGVTYVPDEVPYSETCACNPNNGGSGLCGCTMSNKMVPNPKKTWTTTYTLEGTAFTKDSLTENGNDED